MRLLLYSIVPCTVGLTAAVPLHRHGVLTRRAPTPVDAVPAEGIFHEGVHVSAGQLSSMYNEVHASFREQLKQWNYGGADLWELLGYVEVVGGGYESTTNPPTNAAGNGQIDWESKQIAQNVFHDEKFEPIRHQLLELKDSPGNPGHDFATLEGHHGDRLYELFMRHGLQLRIEQYVAKTIQEQQSKGQGSVPREGKAGESDAGVKQAEQPADLANFAMPGHGDGAKGKAGVVTTDEANQHGDAGKTATDEIVGM